MPSSPAKVCNWCGTAYRGRCSCKNSKPLSAHARGYGRKWRELRSLVISRDPVCRLCQHQLTQEVDHIKRKADGGTDDLNNLQGLCRACHRDKTKAENAVGGGV